MLNDVRHVEAVAIIRTLLNHAQLTASADVIRGVEGWLEENHPPPPAYIAAMQQLSGRREPLDG